MDAILLGENMLMGLLITAIIGAVCGYLGSVLMGGPGLGLIGNIVVGIVGAALFGFLFGQLSLLPSLLGNQILGGTLGAMLLLFLIRLIKR